MIKLITRTSFLISMLLSCTMYSFGQQVYYYDFRNTLNEKSGSGPALNVLGTGNYSDESLPDLSCLERTSYAFTQNSGVQFDNDAAGTFFTTSYTLELYFKFSDNTGFMRVIDFKNRTSDFGLYATNSVLQFYDELTVPTAAFVVDEYVHLTLTRDGGSDEVRMFIDGVFLGSFIDGSGNALPDVSNVINFFQDDLVFGGEARPGAIALLRVYDYPLSDTEVESAYLALENTSAAVAFSPDFTSACFGGNLFNFTNESENTGGVSYSWDFGDGNSLSGQNAAHSYLTDGIFTVYLIADNGAGCVDSAQATIEVYPAPVPDLGLDLEVCDGDGALLDPGFGFAAYLWQDGSTDPTFIVSQPGTFWVEVTDSMGCMAVDSIDVTYIPNPVFTLGADTLLCFGASLTLTAPPGLDTYFWSTGETTQSIVVNAAGFYAVEVTNMEGCMAEDTIEVSINPELIISLGNDTTICDGQAVTLDPGAGFIIYEWSDGSSAQTLDAVTTGFYSVTVTDASACTASAFVNVTVNPAPVVDLGNDTTICGGTILTLDAGPGFTTYLWDDGSSLQTLDVNSAGSYMVTVTDAIGCSGSSTINISANPFVTLGPDVTACDGSQVTLDPGPGYTTYLWSGGSSSQTFDVTTAGVYTVTVTDINGCINSATVQVGFNQLPVVDLGSDIEFCDGSQAVLDAGAGFSGYLWGDGSNSQTLVVTAQGIYSVIVTDSSGCSAQDSVSVTVHPLPVVELGPPQDICAGTATVLDAGAGSFTYLWSDGSSAQLLLVFASGTYTVTVTDSLGCSSTDDVVITVLNGPVVALGADTIICYLDSIMLDAGAGFAAYTWNTGASTQTVFATNANTNYTITVTDLNGCTGTDDIEVSFYAPVPVPTISQVGNTLFSSSATGNQWYQVPGGLIPGATANTYDPPADGTYFVIVTDSNGCASLPSPDFIFVIDGISQIDALQFSIVPNPSGGIISVTPAWQLNGNAVLDVIDLHGKVVLSLAIPASVTTILDLSALQQGIYFVRLTLEQKQAAKKLVLLN